MMILAVMLMSLSSIVVLMPINATAENKDLPGQEDINNNFTMCEAKNVTVSLEANNTFWLNDSDIWNTAGPGCDLEEEKSMVCDCVCKNTFEPVIFVPTSGTAIVTINNINIYTNDAYRLWAHVVMIVYNTGVLCFLLWRLYMEVWVNPWRYLLSVVCDSEE